MHLCRSCMHSPSLTMRSPVTFVIQTGEISYVLRNPFFKSSHGRCSVKKGAFKNFANFTENHLYWSLFSIKQQALRTQVFSYEICEIFKNTFFDEHLRTTAFSSPSFKLYLEDLTVFQDSNLRLPKIKPFATVFLSKFSSFRSDASSFLCYQVRKLRNSFFFLCGFSFMNIHKSQDCRERGKAFLQLLTTTFTSFKDTQTLAGRLLQRAMRIQ